uniref:USP domain-containing protein n=1 Tax=Romanomermis culicivorax TaxID=13658 RepID=A0A915I5N3_ROMCU
MNVRLRSEAAQNRIQSPIRENGSALSLIDKENAIKTTPQRSASSINLTPNRTPLSDKVVNIAKEYEVAAPETSDLIDATPKIFTRSITKRIKPALDVYSTTIHDYSTKRLKRLNNEDDACWKPSTSLSPPSEQTLLGSLPQLLKNKDSASRSMKDELLLRVKNAISASATRFSGYSQHDAHEFLAQVLDQLKEEIKKLCDDNDQKLPNPVANNFEFDVSHVGSHMILLILRFSSCSNTVTKSEQFNDLSLDLPGSPDDDDTPISLQKLIDNFFDSEQVTYKCEQCSCDFSLIKHNFVRMPKILILHVKRYNFDSKISKNVKCSKMICIPPNLSLAEHFIGQSSERLIKGEDETTFRLCGIVTHLGVFSSTGHYVCDVYDMRKGLWRSCDDSRVCDTTELDVCQMRQKDGYIFFYVAE